MERGQEGKKALKRLSLFHSVNLTGSYHGCHCDTSGSFHSVCNLPDYSTAALPTIVSHFLSVAFSVLLPSTENVSLPLFF